MENKKCNIEIEIWKEEEIKKKKREEKLPIIIIGKFNLPNLALHVISTNSSEVKK